MTAIRRASIAAILIVVLAAGIGLWLAFGAFPVPDGYAFPRHSMFGGPAALFEGALEDADGCIRTDGDPSFAVVWPPGYRLGIDGGEPIIHAPFRTVRMGEAVRMGGGYYEDGQPPAGSRDIGACAAPFFLSTGFAEE